MMPKKVRYDDYICIVKHNKYLKGLLEPLILKLLQEEGRLYGYEITQKIKTITAAEIQITEGALYPLLHKLETDGILETELEQVENRVRKYYRLTRKGKKESVKAVDNLQEFVQLMQLLIKPKIA
jgi:PadR family transcriptional regulator, regulatory protein PadR